MSGLVDAVRAQPVVFLVVVLFLAFMVGAGFWARRAVARSEKGGGVRKFLEEYFLAGRSLGGFALAMSMITTYTSASSFIGGPGIAYSLGLGWILLTMIQVPTAFLTLGVLGRKFSEFSEKTGALTVSQFLYHRYRSNLLVAVTSLFMIVFFVAIMLAQFIGGARLFQAITGLPYTSGLIIFGVTVCLYTTIGGFRGVVLTEIIQGVVMLFASVAILYSVIDAGGGLTAILDRMEAIDPGLLLPTGAGGGIPVPFLLSFWVLVGVGVLGLPQTAQKCLAFRDSRSLRRAMIYGTVVIGFMLFAAHRTGALGRGVLPDLPVRDLIMPTLIVRLMPPVLSGLFAAGVLSAIMSTVSSMLIIASATLIRDVYLSWHLKGDLDAAKTTSVKRISTGLTAFLGFAVFVLALEPPDLLAWINLFAFGGLEAVFFWPILLGLFWKKANRTGAFSSVCAGLAAFILMTVFKFSPGGMHAIAPSLVIAGLAFFVGNAFHSDSDPAHERAHA
ncbi:MAG: sodium/pantothenate symporter [Planctomycetes bacterium]|nr:sodium/pantothenate symporter [Planctomycetota bacterium]